MADMVTAQELENAKIDAQTIGESVNENKIVTPRYGAPFKSMPMIAEEMQSVIGTIIAGGVPANIVADESGLSQQQINNNNESALSNRYTKSETDTALAVKANASDLAFKADKADTFTKSEVNALVAPKADKTYVDSAMSNLSTIASKFYPTLAEANADIANIAVNQPVTVGEVANGGLWYKATAGATSLTKSAYDPLEQAKGYTNSKLREELNTNYFKGFDYNAESGVAVTFTKNQDASGLRLVGGNYPLTLPTSGGLDNKFSVWTNVTTAVKNGGNLRVLVQVKKTDKSNAYSAYHDIPATTGWSKVIDINLPTVNASEIEAIYLNIDASGGAELTLKDIYVGESTTLGSKRFEATEDSILRAKTVINIMPNFSQLTVIDGVYYTNDSIAISAGKEFDYTLTITDKSVVYISALVNQTDSRNVRFRLIGTPTDGSAAIQKDIFTTAINGLEFTTPIDFGKPIKSLRLRLAAIGTESVTLNKFTVSYDKFLQSKSSSVAKSLNLSDIIDDSATNIATFPYLDYVRAQTGAVTRNKDNVILSNASDISVSELVADLGVVAGETLYINLIDSNVLKNTGVVTLSQTQVTAANAYVGGTSANLSNGSNLLNIPIIVRNDAVSLLFTVKTTVDATISFSQFSLSRKPVYKNTRLITKRSKDETGVTVSDFPFQKLTNYDTLGETVSYSRTKDANGDYVLSVPVTAATGNGQGARWAIKYDDTMRDKGANFSIQLASGSPNTVKVYIVAKTAEGGIVSEVALPAILKSDGSWTTWFYRLPARHTNGNLVTEMTLTFYQASTATAPLKIKRPLLSAEIPNQFIKHIQYTADAQVEAGIALRDRVYDAIQNPVKGVFAVGQQLFRAEKAAPTKTGDFKHLGGRKEMPTTLIGTKYIDGSGYEIVTIDSDDTVWLRQAGNTNLYKTTVDDLHSRISATTLDSASGEQRGTFNGVGLTTVTSGFVSNMFGKVAGDGSLICVTGQDAKYLPVGASTLSTATGFSDVKGGMLTGWLFDVQDNVVLVGGYSASPNYGKGKINFSNDYGRTYKTILDLENQDVFGATATAGAHIHGCAWDKYWNRVWVVMGDYTIDSKAIGKILWCDNPQSATPIWHIESRDMIQPDKHNEQHISVYPMEDCILFGSDCNPSYIARRARVSKDESTFTDIAHYLHQGLAYYPAQFWQHRKDLPVTIFLGSDLLNIHGDNPDGVLITHDGVTFSRIWSDKNEYSNTVGRTSSYAYALTKERFLLQKRNDPRFASAVCWVVGRLKV